MAKARAETKLPAGLAKNARAKHEAKRQRLADEGFKAISAIKALRTKIADDYLEMGRALRVLKQEGVAEAVGCASFEALCREKLDLSVTRAEQLIALFETLDADTVRALGADRASALMNLADATPSDDSVRDLLTAGLTLPTGRRLDVRSAPIRELNEAATAFRRAASRGTATKPRGLTVDAAEQRRFEAAVKRLGRVVGDEGVATKLIATRKESGADAQVRMPLGAFEALVRAAAKGAK